MSDAEVRDAIGAQVDEFVKRVAYEASSLDLLGLRARVMGLLGPDPAGFDPLISSYSRMALQTGGEAHWDGAAELASPDTVPDVRVAPQVSEAVALVKDWTGDAATAFRTDFAAAFTEQGPTVIKQRLILNGFQLATEAHREVYVRVRSDVSTMLAAGIAAIDSYEDFSSEAIPVSLTVVAAIATVGAAIAAGTTGVGWVMIAAGGSLGASLIGAQAAAPKDRMFDPSSRYDIACRLYELLAELEADVAGGEAQVRTTVQGLTAALDGSPGSRRELVGPSVTGADGGYPMTYAADGTGSLPDSYVDEFQPPSATE